MFILWFSVLFLWVRAYTERILAWPIGVFLSGLGRNSLTTYILSGILIFAVNIILAPTSPVGNFLLDVGMLGITYFLVQGLASTSSRLYYYLVARRIAEVGK